MDDFEVDDAVQRALDRLSLLAEATTALTSSLDPRESLVRVCRVMVPQLADWSEVDLLDDDGHLRRASVVHHDLGVLPLSGLTDLPPGISEKRTGPLARVLAGAGPLLVTATDLPASLSTTDPLHVGQLELFEQLGTDTAVIAPLRVRRQVLGALTLGRGTHRAPLTREDLALVEDLAHRVALGLDNARLYGETQHIAERLQRSLLPQLPATSRIQLAARYTPAGTTVEVGGDWYDSFVLPTGQITLIIGDVTGHDLRAAVTMSELRNMLRGISCDRQEPTGYILRRLDVAHTTLHPDASATCVYGLLEETGGGHWTLEFSSAGHPPPLLITHDGDTRFLTGGHGLLLGVDPSQSRPCVTETLPPRSTVLLFTDGLIERRREHLDAGLTRLRQHASTLAGRPLEAFCDALLSAMDAEQEDDVALLAARLPPAGPARTAVRGTAAPEVCPRSGGYSSPERVPDGHTGPPGPPGSGPSGGA